MTTLIARRAVLCGIALLAFTGACRKPPTNSAPKPAPPTRPAMAYYTEGVAAYDAGKWKAAIEALDQATVLLPPRDTLTLRATMMLAKAYEKRKSWLLASATYKRLFEGYPQDSLADDALLGMANAEANIWRDPELDPHHAILALEAYTLLPRLFPGSSLVKDAQLGEARMNERLARKDLLTGHYYMRLKAWDSALIYLRDASQLYPGTPSAKDALLKMIEIYQRLKKSSATPVAYDPEIAEACAALKSASYTLDDRITKACAGVKG